MERVQKRSVLELQRHHSVDEKTLMVRAVEKEAFDRALSTVTNRMKWNPRFDWLLMIPYRATFWQIICFGIVAFRRRQRFSWRPGH